MKCDNAKDMMDERLQALAEGVEADGDWTLLDAHLTTCDACASDWAELVGTRDGLSGLAGDGPRPEEVDAMWAAVQTQAFGQTTSRTSGRWTGWSRTLQSTPVRAMLATAAVLFFSVGVTVLMDGSTRVPATFTNVEDRLHEAVNSLSREIRHPALGLDALPAARALHPRNVTAQELATSLGEFSDWKSASPAGHENAIAQSGVAAVASSPSGVSTTFEAEVPKYDPLTRAITAELKQPVGRHKSMVPRRTMGRRATATSAAEERSAEFGEPITSLHMRAPSKGTIAAADEDSWLRFGSEGEVATGNAGARKRRPSAKQAEPSPPMSVGMVFRSIDLESEPTQAEYQAGRTTGTPVISGATTGTGTRVLAKFGGDNSPTLEEIIARIDGNLDKSPNQTADDGEKRVSENAQERPPGGKALPPQPDVSRQNEPADAARDGERTTTARPNSTRATRIIKAGELQLEVETYSDAVTGVTSTVRQFGGFVADTTVAEQSGGAMSGTLVIRVAPENFDPLFDALKPTGRVLHEHVKAADVTAEWVDLEARIRGLLITEQRLQELVANKAEIKEVDALLEVERERNRVRTQIEQLQGQLRVMADRVALSTITLQLSEAIRTVPRASFWIEVGDVTDSLQGLHTLVSQLDAKLTSTETTKRDDGTFKADNSLVVSLARFGEMLSQIDTLGRVKHRIVKDWESADADATWADEVRCNVGIIMHERSYQLPAGNVTIEVPTIDAGLSSLNSVLESVDGAIANNSTRRNNDGSVSAELKLSIAAGRFAELVSRLDALGRTLNKTVAGEAGEISGGAAAMVCELSLTLREPARQVPSGNMSIEVDDFAAATNRLSSLVDADKLQVLGSTSTQRSDRTWTGQFRIGVTSSEMENVVASVEKLGHVTSRKVIGLGLGALSTMDKDALGVIELTLTEPAAMRPSPDRASGPIRKAFSDGLAGLYQSLALIVRAVITAAPWLVVAIALLFVVSRTRRRTKKAG